MTQNGLDLIEVLLSNGGIDLFFKGKRKKKFYFDRQELTLLLELRDIVETRHCKTQETLVGILQDMWMRHKVDEDKYLKLLEIAKRYPSVVM